MMNDNQEPQFSSEEAAAEKTVPSSDVETPEIKEALGMGETNNANMVASSADAQVASETDSPVDAQAASEAVATTDMQIADIDASSATGMGGVSDAAIQSAAKTPGKKLRIFIIIGAVIVALALIIGGIVIANFLEENHLKAQIAADLSKDPAVSELVLPGELFDETGFEVVSMRISEFNHSWFSDKASVDVIATLKNGCIQGINRYALEYDKPDGEWDLVSTELKTESYTPYASIPDDVILENLGKLIAKTDETNAEDDIWPVNLTDFFDETTTATIIENDLYDASDFIQLKIERTSNEIEISGDLHIDLFWQLSADSTPQWIISSSWVNSDIYLTISSIPHEGVSRYTTEDEQAASLNKSVGWDEFYTSFIDEPIVEKGSYYAIIGFENIPNNKVDMEFMVTLDETGEVLYQSPRLSPNTCIDTIKLSKCLELGTHSATITIKSYDQGTDRPIELNSTVTYPITINVI